MSEVSNPNITPSTSSKVIDLSSAFFTPTQVNNLLITLSKESDSNGLIKSSALKLDILGFSGESAGYISINGLKPDDAQNLLKAFLTKIPNPLISPASTEVLLEENISPVPHEAVEALLLGAKNKGGKLFSDELGIFPEGISTNYRQIVETMRQREPSKAEFLQKKTGTNEGWKGFERGLVKNVKDLSTLVWIKVEVPPGNGKVAEQRLGHIIEKHLMKSSEPLRDILKESWFEDRAKSYTFPVVTRLPNNYFEVRTSEIQILMDEGFVMTVVESNSELNSQFYKALEDRKVDSQARFVLEAIRFASEENHETITRLDLVHEEIKIQLKKKKVLDIDGQIDSTDVLEDSAREVYFAGDNYITALTGLPDSFFQEDELNIRDELLQYAKKVLELSEALKTDTEELNDRAHVVKQERRDEYVEKVTLVGLTTLAASNFLTAPSAWTELLEWPNLIALGVVSLVSYLGTAYVLKRWKGDRK